MNLPAPRGRGADPTANKKTRRPAMTGIAERRAEGGKVTNRRPSPRLVTIGGLGGGKRVSQNFHLAYADCRYARTGIFKLISLLNKS
jgi:hypothetical protein